MRSTSMGFARKTDFAKRDGVPGPNRYKVLGNIET